MIENYYFNVEKIRKTFQKDFISQFVFFDDWKSFRNWKCARWNIIQKRPHILTDVSNGSKNAVGEMIPVRLFTTMAMPVSINGSLKSTTASRSAFIINDVSTISALRFTKSAIKPFHLPFSSVPHLPSSTRTSSYVKPAIRKCQTHFYLWKKYLFFLRIKFEIEYKMCGWPNGSENFSNKSIQKPEQHW